MTTFESTDSEGVNTESNEMYPHNRNIVMRYSLHILVKTAADVRLSCLGTEKIYGWSSTQQPAKIRLLQTSPEQLG